MKELTTEQAKYYDALDEMFTSAGWRVLIEEATAQIYQNQADSLEMPTWDALNVLRGKSMQLAELTTLEAVTLTQKAILLQEDDDDANL